MRVAGRKWHSEAETARTVPFAYKVNIEGKQYVISYLSEAAETKS